MGLCQVNLSLRKREWLGLILAIFQCVLTFVYLAVIAIGIAILLGIKRYHLVIGPHYGYSLPYMMFATGIIMFLTHGVGVVLCLMSRDWRKADTYKIPLIMFMTSLLVIVWVVLAASIMTYVHTGKIGGAFEKGLTSTLNSYRDGGELKVEIDTIQMSYKCCGATGHSDWFTTPWISENFVDKESPHYASHLNTDGKYVTDSVPFSCCDPRSIHPCVHDNLTQPPKTEHNSSRGFSLHRMGCSEAISFNLRQEAVGPLAHLLMALFLAELVFLMIFRLFQTSIEMAVTWGDPRQDAPGYLCSCGVEAAPPNAPKGPKDLEARMTEMEEQREQLLKSEEKRQTNLSDSVHLYEDPSLGNQWVPPSMRSLGLPTPPSRHSSQFVQNFPYQRVPSLNMLGQQFQPKERGSMTISEKQIIDFGGTVQANPSHTIHSQHDAQVHRNGYQHDYSQPHNTHQRVHAPTSRTATDQHQQRPITETLDPYPKTHNHNQQQPPAIGPYPAQQHTPAIGPYPAQQHTPAIGPYGPYPAHQYPPAIGPYPAQHYPPAIGPYPAQHYHQPPNNIGFGIEALRALQLLDRHSSSSSDSSNRRPLRPENDEEKPPGLVDKLVAGAGAPMGLESGAGGGSGGDDGGDDAGGDGGEGGPGAGEKGGGNENKEKKDKQKKTDGQEKKDKKEKDKKDKKEKKNKKKEEKKDKKNKKEKDKKDKKNKKKEKKDKKDKKEKDKKDKKDKKSQEKKDKKDKKEKRKNDNNEKKKDKNEKTKEKGPSEKTNKRDKNVKKKDTDKTKKGKNEKKGKGEKKAKKGKKEKSSKKGKKEKSSKKQKKEKSSKKDKSSTSKKKSDKSEQKPGKKSGNNAKKGTSGKKTSKAVSKKGASNKNKPTKQKPNKTSKGKKPKQKTKLDHQKGKPKMHKPKGKSKMKKPKKKQKIYKAKGVKKTKGRSKMKKPTKKPKIKKQKKKPKMKRTKMKKPKMKRPKMKKPKMKRPKMKRPKMKRPKMKRPKMKRPKMKRPKMGRVGRMGGRRGGGRMGKRRRR